MPFQSEDQRRYMHANLPDIAKRWERNYAGGGITNLEGRIGFDSGTNYKTRKELIEEADLESSQTLLDFLSEKSTVGSDKYNIKFSPEAELSLSKFSEGDYDVNLKNIMYGGTTTAKLGPVSIDMDITNYLDKYDVTEDDVTVAKDTEKDEQIAFSLNIDLDTLYARIDSNKDFKKFYLTIRKTFNQGGVVPAHEAGIYGLAEGGKIIDGQPHQLSYITPGEAQSLQNLGGRKVMTPEGIPAYPGHFGREIGTSTSSAPESTSGGDGYQTVHDTGAITQTPGRPVYQDRIIETQDRQRKQDLSDIITRGEEEKWDTPEQRIQGKWSGTTQGTIQRENFKQQQALNNWNKVKDSSNTWLKKKAGKMVVDQFLLGGATFGLSDVIGGLIQGFKTNKAKNEFINVIKGSIAEYQKLGFAEHSPHKDTLIQDLNQQLLDLTQTRDRPDSDDGGPGALEETGITYSNIEDKNKKEMASSQWRQEQEKVDRSKQMAYWQMMMTPHMGGATPKLLSAQGGRVPAGYNTGGLSNLFKLKNV